MPQLNFSAPKAVCRLLKNTKPADRSLSRHILIQVLEGVCVNYPPKKKAK